MYRLCHSDEVSASKLGVASDCSSVENVSSITSCVIPTGPYELQKAWLTDYWILNEVLLCNPHIWSFSRISFLEMRKTPITQHLQVLIEEYFNLLFLWRNQGEVQGLE
uniref:Uncharacterized protein n=1 Tax=Lactuca sativa TaxID=4236 RepID=A0A9R1XQ32_LACSA|nr:hypothetical protein LSAT_V11C200056550 [Lactuca sativa]